MRMVRHGEGGVVRELVRQGPHFADSKGGTVVPRPLVELRHVAVVGEVLHVDYSTTGLGSSMDV